MKKTLKDFLIPHDGNDYQPHSLQKAALLGMVMLVLLSFAATNLQAVLWQSSSWLISTVLPAVIVNLTNEERADEALVTLRRSATLDAAAQLKAEHMAQNQYFAHYSPDGVSPWHWFGEADYNFVHAGENLAIHFTDSSAVVGAWMDSPTHRANILNGNYREIGIGIAPGSYEGFETLYVVQLFGTPASLSSTPSAETGAGEPAPIVAAAETTEPESVPDPVSESSDIESEAAEPALLAQAEPEAENVEVLAETIAISEQVEVFAAEPELVPTEVVEVTTVNNTVVVISDHLSTSTGGVPATINTDTSLTTDPSLLGSVATQPRVVLQLLYGTIAAFVVIVLMLSIVIEWRRQHPLQIAYSLALLLFMFGLYQIHAHLSAGALVV